jgi:hypothetical protein
LDQHDERRRSRRFTLNVPASIWLGEVEHGGTLWDMSDSGVFFSAKLEVAAGAPAYVTFQIDGAVAEAVGEVVRTCPFGNELGVGVWLRIGNDAVARFLERLAGTRDWERAGVLAGIRGLALRIG